MFLRALILAIITLGITGYIEVKQYKEKGFNLIKALIGIAITLTFLSYPLYDEYIGIKRIVCSILYATQTLFLNEDFELINGIDNNSIINNLYIILTYSLFLIAPLLSATTLLSLFGNTFSKLKFRISTQKEYHIFSEINEKTIALANKILNTHKNSKIIFTNKENEEKILGNNRKFLKLKEKINELNISKIKKEKYIYFMSNDEESNLNESLEFLDKLEENEQAKIYVLNSNQEAYMIIDSVMSKRSEENKKSKIQVEIINETERIVLQRLQDLPIQNVFDKAKKEIMVLIVGCGEFGQAFLKSITWCFQVIGYSLKIIVVEKNATDVKHKINLEAPELLKRYDINFINEDIETVISEELLKEFNINYAIVTAGTDTNNFNIAIALRRYFLVNNNDNVEIDVLIRNKYKNKNIEILKDEKNKDYNINTFGSIEKEYFETSIIDSDIEKMAKKLHLINNPNDKDFKEFYKSEYNRKSSRASVVHIKYKLYSILLDRYTGDIRKDIENYKRLIQDEDVIMELAKNEHNRWMAYMYTDGYRVASMDALEKYYLKIGCNHKYTLAKLHPALVDNKDLKKVEQGVETVIEKLTGVKEKKNFVEADYDIVQRLDEISLV